MVNPNQEPYPQLLFLVAFLHYILFGILYVFEALYYQMGLRSAFLKWMFRQYREVDDEEIELGSDYNQVYQSTEQKEDVDVNDLNIKFDSSTDQSPAPFLKQSNSQQSNSSSIRYEGGDEETKEEEPGRAPMTKVKLGGKLSKKTKGSKPTPAATLTPIVEAPNELVDRVPSDVAVQQQQINLQATILQQMGHLQASMNRPRSQTQGSRAPPSSNPMYLQLPQAAPPAQEEWEYYDEEDDPELIYRDANHRFMTMQQKRSSSVLSPNRRSQEVLGQDRKEPIVDPFTSARAYSSHSKMRGRKHPINNDKEGPARSVKSRSIRPEDFYSPRTKRRFRKMQLELERKEEELQEREQDLLQLELQVKQDEEVFVQYSSSLQAKKGALRAKIRKKTYDYLKSQISLQREELLRLTQNVHERVKAGETTANLGTCEEAQAEELNALNQDWEDPLDDHVLDWVKMEIEEAELQSIFGEGIVQDYIKMNLTQLVKKTNLGGYFLEVKKEMREIEPITTAAIREEYRASKRKVLPEPEENSRSQAGDQSTDSEGSAIKFGSQSGTVSEAEDKQDEEKAEPTPPPQQEAEATITFETSLGIAIQNFQKTQYLFSAVICLTATRAATSLAFILSLSTLCLRLLQLITLYLGWCTPCKILYALSQVALLALFIGLLVKDSADIVHHSLPIGYEIDLKKIYQPSAK